MTTKGHREVPGDEAQDGGPTPKVAAAGLADIRDGMQGAALAATIVDETPAGGEAPPEAALEADPRVTKYKDHYDRWDQALKIKHPWAEVRVRLLTDTAEGGEPLLTAAEGLVEPVFFGMDAEGNPMFADGKDDPRDLPHCGLDYQTTRQLVRFKEDKDGKQVPTGYAMFPYVDLEGADDKSEEILAFERFTGTHFVSSRDNDQWVESWVESGENPRWPHYVSFDPSFSYAAAVLYGVPERNPRRGVRRLLRGQKA